MHMIYPRHAISGGMTRGDVTRKSGKISMETKIFWHSKLFFLIHHKCKCDATCSKSIVHYIVGPSLNKKELAFTNRQAIQKLNILVFVHQVFLKFVRNYQIII